MKSNKAAFLANEDIDRDAFPAHFATDGFPVGAGALDQGAPVLDVCESLPAVRPTEGTGHVRPTRFEFAEGSVVIDAVELPLHLFETVGDGRSVRQAMYAR